MLILIINLQSTKTHRIIEKPKLSVLIDDSESIEYFKREFAIKSWLDSIKQLKALSNKYDIEYYSFGKGLNSLDKLRFKEPTTDISNAIGQLQRVRQHSLEGNPILLITDGNQTFGEDYQYIEKSLGTIFPICVGDTTKYADLKISRVNVNKYAFTGHKFPLEIFVNYQGTQTVKSKINIKSGKEIIHSEGLTLSASKNSVSINPFIKLKGIGTKTFEVNLEPLKQEKNLANNTRKFGVEIIDDKIKIALISKIVHPDLGTLTKAIESNNQNKVEQIFPNNLRQLDDFDALILYQPDGSFKKVFDYLNQSHKSYLLVSGTKTDWSFLNKSQNIVSIKQPHKSITENIKASLNPFFSDFFLSDIGFSNFSSLHGILGNLQFERTPQVILNKVINGTETSSPLLATIDSDKHRVAYLFGEGIWRWRMQTYLSEKSFEPFDKFINKLIFYLGSNKSKNRIDVDYHTLYYQNLNCLITARFFDKNYNEDPSAELHLKVTNKDSKKTADISMIYVDKLFQADLSYLEPGKYEFNIKEIKQNIDSKGSFTIIPFNQEYQQASSDYRRLKILANNTQGKMINSTKDINDYLLSDEKYLPKVKTYSVYQPLIEFKWLLALILLMLSSEWFLRKYLGLV